MTRRSRWWRRPLPLTLAVLVVAAAVLVALVGSGVLPSPRGSDGVAPPAPSSPALPRGVPRAAPVLTAATGAPVEPSALAAALVEAANDPALGGSVGLSVRDGVTGASLYALEADIPRAPASTLKLITGAAALRTLGPHTRLATRVVSGGPGVLVLVGGGDATLTAESSATRTAESSVGDPLVRASLQDLARQTADALRAAAASSGATTSTATATATATAASRGTPSASASSTSGPGVSPASSAPGPNVSPVEIRVDDSLFGGPAIAAGWESDYVSSGVVSPVDALSLDAGRTRPKDANGISPRVADPALAAGRRFSALLESAGVPVQGEVLRAVAPDGAAPELARVVSAPVEDLVESMLTTSDDDLAEALAHLAGSRSGGAGTFASGAAAAGEALRSLGVPVAGLTLLDGSGLSRGNRVSADTLSTLLATAASSERPELRSLLTGLPVAGWSGTLSDRFGAGSVVVGSASTGPASTGPAVTGSAVSALAAAEGRVRAKTGTLTGVSALAGTVLDRDGRLLVFAALADDVAPGAGTLEARAALDRFAAVLARCGCRVPPSAPPSVPPSTPPSVPPSTPPSA